MKAYWKIALAYLAFGLVWILASDLILLKSSTKASTMAVIEIAKGWFYVSLSTLVIYFVAKRAFRREAAAHEEKLAVYQKTIGSVHHIFLNYLNQMQLVTMEAERFEDFDKETLELSKSISEEAAASLVRLGEIENVSIDGIHSAAFTGDK
jgi:hypothetical protein